MTDQPPQPLTLCLVAAPHQLLNALEAKSRLADDRVELVVLTDTYPAESFEKLASEGDWAQVHILEVQGDPEMDVIARHALIGRNFTVRRLFQDLERKRRVDRFARKFTGVRRLLLGNYDPLQRHFANALPTAEIVLLDDGTDTLKINGRRHERFGITLSSAPRRARESLRARAIGLNVRQAESVTFFTTYDLDLAPGDKKIPNDYAHLRARAKASETSDEIYLLGQPLTEDATMDEREYFRYVAHAKEYLSGTGSRIVYVPHKREQPDRVARLSQHTHLPIMHVEGPIELALVRSHVRPRAVASFYSSALENCALVFGDAMSVYAFYIEERHMLKEHELVRQCFDYFRHKRADSISLVLYTPAP